MMLRLHDWIRVLILIWSVVNGRSLAPFDIRIDHHKVDTTRDLIINTARPGFSWKIPFPKNISEQRNIQQTAYQIQFESVKLTDRDTLYRWDSERVVSSQATHVRYQGQSDLLPSTYYRLRVRVWTTNSKEASEWTRWIQFRTPIFHLHEYLTQIVNATWIGSTKINMNELRKEFNVPNASPVKSVIVYVTGLGYYEFYLNGNKVDLTRKLDPGWTTYEKRTLVASYDVTANITAGMNAVGVKLGNGWYGHEQGGYGAPRLIFALNITFQSGDQMQVLSDLTWTGREGSIKHDSVYNGEFCDGRGYRPGWCEAGFNDSYSAWVAPESLPSPVGDSGLLVLQDMPPIRAGEDALHFEVNAESAQEQRSYLTSEDVGEIKGAALTAGVVIQPVSSWNSDSGVHTFDLGQNIAGWCRLRFLGPPGYGTYVRHGEALVQGTVGDNNPTHNIYTENLREATASDTYILYGNPVFEIYEPTFTYHGFRYISVYGSPNPLALDDVECPFVHSETTLKGNFTSSNAIINQIQHNVQWGQLSNSMSLPTDCPQRNERRGWMGDAALTVNEALYNFDLVKFYLNFLNLISDVQLADGQVPDFVPGNSYNPDPNWGTALPTIAWYVYRHTNDSSLLAPYYNNVRAYVEYIRKGYNQTGLVNLFCKYGDWVPPPPFGQTNRALISSFAFLHDVNILLNMSQVLANTNDTAIYAAFYQQLTEEFHRVFFNNASNTYADGMQAAQVLALALPGVVPANLRGVVVDNLAADISKQGNHVTTGIVSNAQIYPVLSDNGHHDLALQLVSSITYPSYGYMFNNPYENATTIWELWNTPLTGPGMNSRNHHMYSTVGAWFYTHLAGIELASDGVTIRPRMASEQNKHLMKKLDCQLSTLYGLVHVSYTRDERDAVANSILLRVTIPPNTQARIMFEPLFSGAQCKTLTEGSQRLWSSDVGALPDNQGFKVEKDSTTNLMSVHVGSGQYQFHAVWN